MKKFGYTIAETLITLAIIGVVGAITLPTFISSHRNQTNAASLSIAVSNLENALTSYIMKEGVTNLYQTKAWEELYISTASSNSLRPEDIDRFIASLEGVFVASTGVGNQTNFLNYYTNANPLKNISGTNVSTVSVTGISSVYWRIRAKNGTEYFINFADKSGDANPLTEAQAMLAGGALTNTCAKVIVDVNGSQKPNTIGRDIFRFDLGSDGILYPCGSIDYSIKNQESASSWKDPESDWTCTNEQKDDSGFGCTARLIEENYKPTY